MADLGAIGLTFRLPSDDIDLHLNDQSFSGSNLAVSGSDSEEGTVGSLTSPTINLFYASLPGAMQVQGDGETRAVTGQVTENGSPVSGVLVRAYRRSDGAFLGEKTTDGSGEYSIKIYADNSQVFVIAFDPTGGVNYNAVIKDKVVPV